MNLNPRTLVLPTIRLLGGLVLGLALAAVVAAPRALAQAEAEQAATADPEGIVAPEVLEAARAGDPAAALAAGNALTAVWEEPRLRAALPFFLQAARDFPPGWERAAAMLMSARMLRALSDYGRALEAAEAAEAVFAALPEPANAAFGRGLALQDQASSLQALSRYPESLQRLAAARGAYMSAAPPFADAAELTWWDAGIAYEGMDEFPAALTAYGRAIARVRAMQGPGSLDEGYLSTNIGWVKTRMGELGEAREWQRRALDIMLPALGPFHENTAKLHINLGLVEIEDGRPDAAIAWTMKAMPFIAANRTQMLSDQRWAFELLSRSFAEKGQSARAILFGKMAVNAQQEIRQTNAHAGKAALEASQAEWHRLYRDLADLMIAEGRISEAQAVLNMAKEEEVHQFLRRSSGQALSQTRALLTAAEAEQAAAFEALMDAPIAADRELRAILARLDAGSATADDEDRALALQEVLQAAADRFDASSAAFLAAVPEADRPRLAETMQALGSYQAVLEGLDRPTAILQVAALDEATHLFLTLPGVALHREVAIPRAELSRLVFEALAALEAVAPDAPDRLAALDAVLFAPVADDLAAAGIEVVMLNLEGFLRYVPFAALNTGGRYRVEDFAFVLYLPAVPTQFAPVARDAAAAAGFGVTQAHPGFSALPGVREELKAIFGAAGSAAAAGAGVLEGETALDAAFDERMLRRSLLRRPTILHIASHFSLVPGQEDASFLLMGDGSHLPLSQIRTTRALSFRGVDLLTLSACQTARGGDGSEIDGFAATAQLNGAGSVLASLWPVSDDATPRLMRDFYGGLMDGGLDKAEALRRAQVAMLRGDAGAGEAPEGAAAAATVRAAVPMEDAVANPGRAHPFFWSAFVLMGNWL